MKELRVAIRTEFFLLWESPTSPYLPGPSIQALDLSFWTRFFSVKLKQLNEYSILVKLSSIDPYKGLKLIMQPTAVHPQKKQTGSQHGPPKTWPLDKIGTGMSSTDLLSLVKGSFRLVKSD